MLDSDEPGIRAAAFNRIDALISAGDMVWSEVLREIFAERAAAPMSLSGVDFGHCDQCRELLRGSRDVLSRWEINFLTKIAGKAFLTDREAARFEQITQAIKFRRDMSAEFGGDGP